MCQIIFKRGFLFPVLNILPILLILISLGSCILQRDTDRLELSEIESRIKTVLELPSYEYVYRDIIYIAEQADFLGFRHKDKQLLFAVDVKLQAGIDLSKGIRVKQEPSAGLTISLPAPEILLIDADENSITQYFKKEFGGEIGRLEYYDEIFHSKTRIRRDALDRGILAKARENAASVVGSLIQGRGISPVTIEFHQQEVRP